MTSLLAANNFGDTMPPGQAGPLGLLIIIMLGIACWFLYRSMSRHIRRVPTSFDEPQERPARAKKEHPAP